MAPPCGSDVQPTSLTHQSNRHPASIRAQGKAADAAARQLRA